jgi:hypothetical protein
LLSGNDLTGGFLRWCDRSSFMIVPVPRLLLNSEFLPYRTGQVEP